MAVPYSNGPEPFANDDTHDIKALLKEVRQGCPNHEKRLVEAREIQDFYDGNSEKYVPFKPSEDNLSWLTRPKRVSAITREAVVQLTSHLYSPGPRSRRINGNELDDRQDINAWYEQVVKDIHLNGVMVHVDRLTTLHGLCMMGIYTTGVERRPIRYHLFPRQDFCFWTSPDDPRVATAVCTITKFGEQVRYRLWTETHYYTFWRKVGWGLFPGGMTVGRFDPEASGPHKYGTLPFCFFSHELPTTELETKGLGYLLRKINLALNTDKSNLALWVHHYARPLGFISGVGPEWRPKFVDGGFVPLVVRHDSTEDAPVVPSASYLESSFDISAVRQWIVGEANQFLAEIGVPISIGTTSGTDSGNALNAPSGKAIEANDADLLVYAKQRQPLFDIYESKLAELVCRLGGSIKSGMESAFAERLIATANDMKLRVSWPEPTINQPGQERDLADQWEMDTGLTDPIELLMRRQGLTEDEAIEQYRKVQVRRQRAVVIAALAVDAVDATTGDRIDEVTAPIETPYDANDEADDTEVTGDMGVSDGGKPSDATAPETSVTPSVTVTSVVLPSTPIGDDSIIAAARSGYGGLGGTES